MKMLILAFAATLATAGSLAAIPAATAAPADGSFKVAQIEFRLGGDHDGVRFGRHRHRDRYDRYDRRFRHRDRDDCRTIVTTERRHGRVIKRKVRRCR